MTIKRLLHKLKMAPKFFSSHISYFMKWYLMKIAKNAILNPFNRSVRPWLWKKIGVKINGKISIGYDVYLDAGYAHLLTIEDGVWITSRCLLFCHKRILDDYHVGDDYNKLPYKTGPIHLKKGCCIGMDSLVFPGVTVGEGAIVAAGSLVTKDIPAWCVAAGRPAKPIKFFEPRETTV